MVRVAGSIDCPAGICAGGFRTGGGLAARFVGVACLPAAGIEPFIWTVLPARAPVRPGMVLPGSPPRSGGLSGGWLAGTGSGSDRRFRVPDCPDVVIRCFINVIRSIGGVRLLIVGRPITLSAAANGPVVSRGRHHPAAGAVVNPGDSSGVIHGDFGEHDPWAVRALGTDRIAT